MSWVIKETAEEIKKIREASENENINSLLGICVTVKAVLKEKFMTMSVYNKKKRNYK
jgi:hypothetical protein